jgi:hypothetical protein
VGHLSNGALLKAAEDERFDLLLTTDRRLQYQQNLKDRKIAIVVLTGTTKWSQVQLHLERIAAFSRKPKSVALLYCDSRKYSI